VLSPLADRPYALRHAAVSLWLNAGVPATEVAERAGHSVEVLLRVYAKCVDGGEAMVNARISEALRAGSRSPVTDGDLGQSSSPSPEHVA
jgi:integrase